MSIKRIYLKKAGRVLIGILGTFVLLVLAAYLLFGRGGEASSITWGVSFDPYYAESLGLDWQKTYLSILDELGVRRLRLVALWDAIEPEDDRYDFSRLDFQIREAEKRGAKVILAVGRRLPRWPECHIPDWAATLSEEEQQLKVLELLPYVVNRYKKSSAIEYWQVENEPYVTFFGECPGSGVPFVQNAFRALEFLDPAHPILLTDSGEVSTWLPISQLGDNLGISMYRKIYDGNYTGLYISYRPF
ncbi:MAG: beta-galactosidase, partial [Patescibacteria group bacterium]